MAAAVATAALGLASAPASATVPVLVLDGTGHGHGVGLSQWGAEQLARRGATAGQILGTFYPGVALGQAAGPVRVVVHRPAVGSTTLSFPQGGEVRSPAHGRQTDGFPVRVGRGGQVRITFDGAYRVTALLTGQSAGRPTLYQQGPCALAVLCPTTTAPPATTTTTPPPRRGGTGGGGPGGGGPNGGGGSPRSGQGAGATAVSSSPVTAVPAAGGVTRVDDRNRAYRGAIEATGAGALRLVNLVGVEDYLRGMAEVPGTWPPAAVQAQAVAARTYALRAMRSSGEICDDARCQVYVGVAGESPGQDAAVATTAGQVITYEGALAAAVYSADAGGVSANTLEGFGTPDGVYPYLRNVAYPTDNPLPWHLEVALADVAARLGYPGELAGVRVTERGPSGRALSLRLAGTAGDRVVDGRTFARALGLRSTRFEVTAGAAVAPPPPPPAEEAVQALPEETAEAARAPARLRLEPRFERPGSPSALAERTDLPEALDPRRHPLTLVAVLLVSMVAGGLVPLHLATARAGARGSARWRALTRRR